MTDFISVFFLRFPLFPSRFHLVSKKMQVNSRIGHKPRAKRLNVLNEFFKPKLKAQGVMCGLQGSNPCFFPLAGVTPGLVEATWLSPAQQDSCFLLQFFFSFYKLKCCVHLIANPAEQRFPWKTTLPHAFPSSLTPPHPFDLDTSTVKGSCSCFFWKLFPKP